MKVEALEILASEGSITHRDISPKNIMLRYPQWVETNESKTKFKNNLFMNNNDCELNLENDVNPVLIDFDFAKEISSSDKINTKKIGFNYFII
jgi:serine/threonine protein kinase